MRERLIEILKKTVIDDEYGHKVVAGELLLPKIFEAFSDQLIAEGVIVPPKKTSQEELWENNIQSLHCGAFGRVDNEECVETLLRYWKAQEQAGYPNASENVKYFESLIAERSK